MSAKGHLPTFRGSTQSSRHRTTVSRQPHRELGEVTDFAIDRDGATVLQRYDLIAYRQPKPGALAGRLGRKERLEQFFPVFRRNPDAIVAHPDLDASVEPPGRHLQFRAIRFVALPTALVSGIEAIADEVEEHASELLRHDINGYEIAVEVVLQCDVKVWILRTGAVIGEVEGLLGERVQIGRLPIIAAATRVLQHTSDNTVGAAA